MTFDEFCPELRGMASFQDLLKEFGLTEQQYDEKLKDWVVYYTQLPDELDGHSAPKEIQLNENLEPFNRKLTFIHELPHALQYETGQNVVKFQSNSGELQNLDELKEYINDPGEVQAARHQLRYLVVDQGMDQEQAWRYMKAGWGMEKGPAQPEVEKVVRAFFDKLWKELDKGSSKAVSNV